MHAEEKVVLGAKANVLYELAQAMATNYGQSAIALRKLAQAGYGSLNEVNSTSDWMLLSIPGLGVGRLSAVRRLTRLDWQPPSPQAVKAVNRFVSAARLALRYWPPEALASLVQDSISVSPSRESYERRLTIECFSRATRHALNYSPPDELTEIVRMIRSDRQCPRIEPLSESDVEVGPHEHQLQGVAASGERGTTDRRDDRSRETDHFAYPEQERRDIVRHYRAARERGEVRNKEQWAHANYSISARTLFNYEREFSELDRDP